MTDIIQLDLNRSEAQSSNFLQQILDHQDTMNSLNEAVEMSRP